MTHTVSTEEDFARVAAISANDDDAIGRVVARALHTVGDDGVVTVEDSPVLGLSVEFVEDFEFDNGYVTPYMVTNPGTLEAVVDDPYILFSAEKIKDVQSIMPVLDKIMRADRRPLVIVAETVEGTALQMLVHNHVNRTFQAVAIKAPGFGEKRIHLLEDMAALCGGKVHSKSSSFALEQMTTEHLGRATQVRVTSDNTTIIGGRGDRSALEQRLCQLRAELARATIGTDEDFFSDRIARLSGKAAIIHVGAPTNAEAKEVRHRVDDSLQATRAAIAEGIVAGGGAALLHAEPALDRWQVDGDYRIGVEIVRSALTEPVHLIASNAGYDGDDVVKQVSATGRRRRLRRAGGPLRQHGGAGDHRPAAGGALGAAERRVGGGADPHHELAGGGGGHALEQGADDGVRAAGRGHPAAVPGLLDPAVPGSGPVGGLIARKWAPESGWAPM